MNLAQPPAPGLGDESFTADEMAILRKAHEAAAKGGRRAISAWRDAAKKLPHKHRPYTALKRLYAEAGKWRDVAKVIETQLEHAPAQPLEQHVALLRELARVYGEHLRKPALAVKALRSLEQIFTQTGDTARLLEVLDAQLAALEAAKRWPDLIECCRRHAELTTDLEQRKRLHLRVAKVFLDQFGDAEEASRSFDAALACDPDDPTAVSNLRDIYTRYADDEKLRRLEHRQLPTNDTRLPRRRR